MVRIHQTGILQTPLGFFNPLAHQRNMTLQARTQFTLETTCKKESPLNTGFKLTYHNQRAARDDGTFQRALAFATLPLVIPSHAVDRSGSRVAAQRF
jgi:hypothetical protein